MGANTLHRKQHINPIQVRYVIFHAKKAHQKLNFDLSSSIDIRFSQISCPAWRHKGSYDSYPAEQSIIEASRLWDFSDIFSAVGGDKVQFGI